VPGILIMSPVGTPGEGTRPTRCRFCGFVGRVPSPGAGSQGHSENCCIRAAWFVLLACGRGGLPGEWGGWRPWQSAGCRSGACSAGTDRRGAPNFG
jgi:hypothetical protein